MNQSNFANARAWRWLAMTGILLSICAPVAWASLTQSVDNAECRAGSNQNCPSCRVYQYPTNPPTICASPEQGCWGTKCPGSTATFQNNHCTHKVGTLCSQTGSNEIVSCGAAGFPCQDHYCGCSVSRTCQTGCECSPANFVGTYPTWTTWPICNG